MKPTVQATGEDGNMFSILGRCTRALKSIDERDKARELSKRVMSSHSYDDALMVMADYVEFE